MVKHKNERRAYIDFMRNKIRKENEIYVFDAGFDGINFIKKLENLKINYIVRIKKNSTFLKNEITDHIHITKDGIQIRAVTYKINNKEYYLATNLMDTKEFTVAKLKELYHQRWSAEEFFKHVKSIFNFAYMNNKTFESIQKSIYGQLIILRIIALLAKINEKKKHLCTKTKTINKKLLADGLFNGFLYLLLNGKLKRKQIDEFNTNYVIVITTNKGKHIPRTCARPFMKWYIKQHFKK